MITWKTLPLVAVAGLAFVSTGWAEDILLANFADQPPGHPKADVGTLEVWTGPEAAPFGSGGIADITHGGDITRAFELTENNAEKNSGPILHLHAPDFFTRAGSPVFGEFRTKILVPANPPYSALFFMGGYWRDGAVTLQLADGKARLYSYDGKGDVFTDVAEYQTNEWVDIRVVFDFAQRTYSVWWNGEKVAVAVPWVNRDAHDPAILIQADTSETSRQDEPVLDVASAQIAILDQAPGK